ncbi:MAG: hypothetical protein ACRCTG_11200 [Aestuariivirga sp.]
MAFRVKVNGAGLLNYAKAGREAVDEVKKAMRRVLNAGRTKARQEISAQFKVRTGFLRRQSRKMQTKVSVRAAEVKGQVSPLPRLLNIFERGATLAQGRGHLRPRPVVAPASRTMEGIAEAEFDKVLKGVGQ